MSIYASLSSAVSPKNRRLTGALWLLVNLAYELARVTVISRYFSQHGVNSKVYLVFCLVAAVLFGYLTLRLTIKIVEHKTNAAVIFGALSLVSFFAPDAYVVISAHSAPKKLFYFLGVYLTITTIISIYALVRKIKSRRSDA